MGTAVGIGLGVAGVAGAAGSIYGAKEQSSAARKAASTEAQAMMRGQDIRRDMFEKQLELQEPYREAGYEALPQYQALAMGEEQPPATEMMGPEQADVYNRMAQQTQQPLEESPYYQWRLGEGEEAINQAMAARGIQSSRPAINALADQRRALSGEMTQRRYNRMGQQYNMLQGARQNRMNQLSNLMNVGQGAAARGSQAAGQFGSQAANLQAQAGQARAQGQMRQGNIQANMYSNLGSMPMNAMSTYFMGKNAGVF